MAFEESKLDRRRLDRISEQQEQIAKLEKQLAGYRKSTGSFLKATEANATLRAQLQRFGGHTAECASHRTLGRPLGYALCDCNWAEIEKGLG